MIPELPRGRVQDQKFFGALESLRGVAALFIVLYHIPRWYEPFYQLGLVRSGHLAVEFFFVLSGFVLYHRYGFGIRSQASLGKFVRQRLFRLYPVHLLFTLLFFAYELAKYLFAIQRHVTPTESLRELLVALLENTLLVQGLGLRHRRVFLNFPSWSISTEFYTYLIFGFALLCLSRKRFIPFAAGISFVSIAVLTLFVDGSGEFQQLLRCVGGFFLGCVARAIFARLSGDEAKHDWAAALLAGFVVALSLNFSAPPKIWELSFPFSALLILALATKPSGATSKALSWPPLKSLGQISYSLYMSHAVALRIAGQILQRVLRRSMAGNTLPSPPLTLPLAVLAYLATILVVIAVAWLTYLVVERPSKMLVRAFAHTASFARASRPG